ncbi:Carboxyvinyl-carboxyphosphonate phosphorylmutase [Roseovarius albus]|uniref:Carboxyvinyl-carboxyphosphonate phosphorylmutase n=1 Tax=Roseovarius albus TaxID=1247867 RepID=A0A1X6ZTK1_9RHOB|nr:isocitrate lyase/phosphoenolpyruvate mutase family protein [Roseovarius albus]SLN61091.1 Carboxyvinyl-carboxyphosphonate phosphorylmutase [Roseovarius albus]
MTTQIEKAKAFATLHVKGQPVILFNIWDAGSASVVAEAGAAAIATGSAPVAMAQGYGDGQNMPLEEALANAARIVGAVDLPVSLDFEGAYAVEAEGIKANVTRALETGVVGFNFEDQVVGTSDLHAVDVQAARVRVMRDACDAAGVPAYINARTDLFLKAAPEDHSEAMLEEAITRAKAFADAGASGFFAPALKDEAMIARLCAATDLPVNIIALPGTPENSRLADLGVARISYGPVPYKKMVSWLGDQAEAALGSLG